jgi:hypothetical protein
VTFWFLSAKLRQPTYLDPNRGSMLKSIEGRGKRARTYLEPIRNYMQKLIGVGLLQEQPVICDSV